MEKKRSAGVVSGETVVGEVEGRVAIIIDDMIVSGGTIARTVKACHERGASGIVAAATHGLFVGTADENLGTPQLQQLLITDTVPPFRVRRDDVRAKIGFLNATPLFAEAIKRIHSGGSIVNLITV